MKGALEASEKFGDGGLSAWVFEGTALCRRGLADGFHRPEVQWVRHDPEYPTWPVAYCGGGEIGDGDSGV